MSIGKRLRQAIEASDLKVKDFSDKTGIAYRTLQQYLSDDRAPAADALTKLCAQTRINVHWLLTGEGAMYRDQIQSLPEQSLSQRHAALLSLFDAVSDEQQREILAVAKKEERLNAMQQQLGDLLKKLG